MAEVTYREALRRALDEELDRWIPYAESMRRRGFVMAGGQWISREESEARQRAREEELARRRAERAATQAAEATQAVREVELALALCGCASPDDVARSHVGRV